MVFRRYGSAGLVARLAYATVATMALYLSLWHNGDRLKDRLFTSRRMTTDTYDFIVVGAGSAGGVVAHRLSEKFNVLLLEAGGEPFPLSSIPGFSLYLLGYRQHDWNFLTIPQKGACLAHPKQQSGWSQGKVLGGTSTLNFMVHTRGHPRDYEAWANITNDQRWNYDNLLPFFKKSEDFAGEYELTGLHGKAGPMRIQIPDAGPHAIAGGTFVQAAIEMGYSKQDLNGRFTEGFDRTYMSVKNGRRQSSYSAFLRPINRRRSLTIAKFAHVNKVLLRKDSDEAYGVEYERHGRTRQAFATKEVILSTGSVQTPRLLMLSGIGPKDHLEKMRIPIRVDSPAVGQNMQDHASTTVGPFISESSTRSTVLLDRDLGTREIVSYLTRGTGIFAISGPSAMGYVSSSYAKAAGEGDWPDIQYLFTGVGVYRKWAEHYARAFHLRRDLLQRYFANAMNKDSFFVSSSVSRPKQRGEILLTSRNPKAPLHIDPKYLQNEDDVKVGVEAVKTIVNLVENAPIYQKLKTRFTNVSFPGCEQCEFRSDAYWECYIRHLTVTLHHIVGTSSMGPPDPQKAVVDSELRVNGVKNLRVIDASVAPKVPVGNTQAMATVIGERGAAFVLEQWDSSYPKSSPVSGSNPPGTSTPLSTNTEEVFDIPGLEILFNESLSNSGKVPGSLIDIRGEPQTFDLEWDKNNKEDIPGKPRLPSPDMSYPDKSTSSYPVSVLVESITESSDKLSSTTSGSLLAGQVSSVGDTGKEKDVIDDIGTSLSNEDAVAKATDYDLGVLEFPASVESTKDGLANQDKETLFQGRSANSRNVMGSSTIVTDLEMVTPSATSPKQFADDDKVEVVTLGDGIGSSDDDHVENTTQVLKYDWREIQSQQGGTQRNDSAVEVTTFSSMITEKSSGDVANEKMKETDEATTVAGIGKVYHEELEIGAEGTDVSALRIENQIKGDDEIENFNKVKPVSENWNSSLANGHEIESATTGRPMEDELTESAVDEEVVSKSVKNLMVDRIESDAKIELASQIAKPTEETSMAEVSDTETTTVITELGESKPSSSTGYTISTTIGSLHDEKVSSVSTDPPAQINTTTTNSKSMSEDSDSTTSFSTLSSTTEEAIPGSANKSNRESEKPLISINTNLESTTLQAIKSVTISGEDETTASSQLYVTDQDAIEVGIENWSERSKLKNASREDETTTEPESEAAEGEALTARKAVPQFASNGRQIQFVSENESYSEIENRTELTDSKISFAPDQVSDRPPANILSLLKGTTEKMSVFESSTLSSSSTSNSSESEVETTVANRIQTENVTSEPSVSTSPPSTSIISNVQFNIFNIFFFSSNHHGESTSNSQNTTSAAPVTTTTDRAIQEDSEEKQKSKELKAEENESEALKKPSTDSTKELEPIDVTMPSVTEKVAETSQSSTSEGSLDPATPDDVSSLGKGKEQGILEPIKEIVEEVTTATPATQTLREVASTQSSKPPVTESQPRSTQSTLSTSVETSSTESTVDPVDRARALEPITENDKVIDDSEEPSDATLKPDEEKREEMKATDKVTTTTIATLTSGDTTAATKQTTLLTSTTQRLDAINNDFTLPPVTEPSLSSSTTTSQATERAKLETVSTTISIEGISKEVVNEVPSTTEPTGADASVPKLKPISTTTENSSKVSSFVPEGIATMYDSTTPQAREPPATVSVPLQDTVEDLNTEKGQSTSFSPPVQSSTTPSEAITTTATSTSTSTDSPVSSTTASTTTSSSSTLETTTLDPVSIQDEDNSFITIEAEVVTTNTPTRSSVLNLVTEPSTTTAKVEDKVKIAPTTEPSLSIADSANLGTSTISNLQVKKEVTTQPTVTSTVETELERGTTTAPMSVITSTPKIQLPTVTSSRDTTLEVVIKTTESTSLDHDKVTSVAQDISNAKGDFLLTTPEMSSSSTHTSIKSSTETSSTEIVTIKSVESSTTTAATTQPEAQDLLTTTVAMPRPLIENFDNENEIPIARKAPTAQVVDPLDRENISLVNVDYRISSTDGPVIGSQETSIQSTSEATSSKVREQDAETSVSPMPTEAMKKVSSETELTSPSTTVKVLKDTSEVTSSTTLPTVEVEITTMLPVEKQLSTEEESSAQSSIEILKTFSATTTTKIPETAATAPTAIMETSSLPDKMLDTPTATSRTETEKISDKETTTYREELLVEKDNPTESSTTSVTSPTTKNTVAYTSSTTESSTTGSVPETTTISQILDSIATTVTNLFVISDDENDIPTARKIPSLSSISESTGKPTLTSPSMEKPVTEHSKNMDLTEQSSTTPIPVQETSTVVVITVSTPMAPTARQSVPEDMRKTSPSEKLETKKSEENTTITTSSSVSASTSSEASVTVGEDSKTTENQSTEVSSKEATQGVTETSVSSDELTTTPTTMTSVLLTSTTGLSSASENKQLPNTMSNTKTSTLATTATSKEVQYDGTTVRPTSDDMPPKMTALEFDTTPASPVPDDQSFGGIVLATTTTEVTSASTSKSTSPDVEQFTTVSVTTDGKIKETNESIAGKEETTAFPNVKDSVTTTSSATTASNLINEPEAQTTEAVTTSKQYQELEDRDPKLNEVDGVSRDGKSLLDSAETTTPASSTVAPIPTVSRTDASRGTTTSLVTDLPITTSTKSVTPESSSTETSAIPVNSIDTTSPRLEMESVTETSAQADVPTTLRQLVEEPLTTSKVVIPKTTEKQMKVDVTTEANIETVPEISTSTQTTTFKTAEATVSDITAVSEFMVTSSEPTVAKISSEAPTLIEVTTLSVPSESIKETTAPNLDSDTAVSSNTTSPIELPSDPVTEKSTMQRIVDAVTTMATNILDFSQDENEIPLGRKVPPAQISNSLIEEEVSTTADGLTTPASVWKIDTSSPTNSNIVVTMETITSPPSSVEDQVSDATTTMKPASVAMEVDFQTLKTVSSSVVLTNLSKVSTESPISSTQETIATPTPENSDQGLQNDTMITETTTYSSTTSSERLLEPEFTTIAASGIDADLLDISIRNKTVPVTESYKIIMSETTREPSYTEELVSESTTPTEVTKITELSTTASSIPDLVSKETTTPKTTAPKTVDAMVILKTEDLSIPTTTSAPEATESDLSDLYEPVITTKVPISEPTERSVFTESEKTPESSSTTELEFTTSIGTELSSTTERTKLTEKTTLVPPTSVPVTATSWRPKQTTLRLPTTILDDPMEFTTPEPEVSSSKAAESSMATTSEKTTSADIPETRTVSMEKQETEKETTMEPEMITSTKQDLSETTLPNEIIDNTETTLPPSTTESSLLEVPLLTPKPRVPKELELPVVENITRPSTLSSILDTTELVSDFDEATTTTLKPGIFVENPDRNENVSEAATTIVPDLTTTLLSLPDAVVKPEAETTLLESTTPAMSSTDSNNVSTEDITIVTAKSTQQTPTTAVSSIEPRLFDTTTRSVATEQTTDAIAKSSEDIKAVTPSVEDKTADPDPPIMTDFEATTFSSVKVISDLVRSTDSVNMLELTTLSSSIPNPTTTKARESKQLELSVDDNIANVTTTPKADEMPTTTDSTNDSTIPTFDLSVTTVPESDLSDMYQPTFSTIIPNDFTTEDPIRPGADTEPLNETTTVLPVTSPVQVSMTTSTDIPDADTEATTVASTITSSTPSATTSPDLLTVITGRKIPQGLKRIPVEDHITDDFSSTSSPTTAAFETTTIVEAKSEKVELNESMDVAEMSTVPTKLETSTIYFESTDSTTPEQEPALITSLSPDDESETETTTVSSITDLITRIYTSLTATRTTSTSTSVQAAKSLTSTRQAKTLTSIRIDKSIQAVRQGKYSSTVGAAAKEFPTLDKHVRDHDTVEVDATTDPSLEKSSSASDESIADTTTTVSMVVDTTAFSTKEATVPQDQEVETTTLAEEASTTIPDDIKTIEEINTTIASVELQDGVETTTLSKTKTDTSKRTGENQTVKADTTESTTEIAYATTALPMSSENAHTTTVADEVTTMSSIVETSTFSETGFSTTLGIQKSDQVHDDMADSTLSPVSETMPPEPEFMETFVGRSPKVLNVYSFRETKVNVTMVTTEKFQETTTEEPSTTGEWTPPVIEVVDDGSTPVFMGLDTETSTISPVPDTLSTLPSPHDGADQEVNVTDHSTEPEVFTSTVVPGQQETSPVRKTDYPTVSYLEDATLPPSTTLTPTTLDSEYQDTFTAMTTTRSEIEPDLVESITVGDKEQIETTTTSIMESIMDILHQMVKPLQDSFEGQKSESTTPTQYDFTTTTSSIMEDAEIPTLSREGKAIATSSDLTVNAVKKSESKEKLQSNHSTASYQIDGNLNEKSTEQPITTTEAVVLESNTTVADIMETDSPLTEAPATEVNHAIFYSESTLSSDTSTTEISVQKDTTSQPLSKGGAHSIETTTDRYFDLDLTTVTDVPNTVVPGTEMETTTLQAFTTTFFEESVTSNFTDPGGTLSSTTSVSDSQENSTDNVTISLVNATTVSSTADDKDSGTALIPTKLLMVFSVTLILSLSNSME